METVSVKYNVGSVGTNFGQLTFSFIVQDRKSAHLQIYAHVPKDLRRSGVVLTFNESDYSLFKQFIAKTDEMIVKLRASGQMRKMRFPFPMNSSVAEINLGSLGWEFGKLTFTLCVTPSGNGYLRLYANNPSDLRISGVMAFLEQRSYDSLKHIVASIDAIIERTQMPKEILVADNLNSPTTTPIDKASPIYAGTGGLNRTKVILSIIIAIIGLIVMIAAAKQIR